MEELLPGAQTLGLYEASLLVMLLVERRYRNWAPRFRREGDARSRALKAMAAHLAAAFQINQRLRSEAPQGDRSEGESLPVVVQPDELTRPLESAILSVWVQLSRSGPDPLEHLASLARLGDSLVFQFCDVLLRRSMFDADLFYRIGTVFEGRGHLVRALDTYQRVVALDPSFRDAPAKIAALRGLSTGLTTDARTPAPVIAAQTSTLERVVTPAPSSTAPAQVAASPSRQSLARVELATLSAPARSPATREEQQLRAAIVQVAQDLDRLSHFEILGISEATGSSEVNAAMLRASRRFHPDRLPASLRDLAPRTERIMARISEAAAILSDPKRRAEYVMDRARAQEPSPRDVMDAELSFRKGLAALNNGNHGQAIDAFRGALAKKPRDPDYEIYLAWATFDDPRAARSGGLTEEITAKIQAFLNEHPQFGRGHYWLGMIWKSQDNPKKAEAAFKAAIGHDKSLMEAERELRLLRMRRDRQ